MSWAGRTLPLLLVAAAITACSASNPSGTPSSDAGVTDAADAALSPADAAGSGDGAVTDVTDAGGDGGAGAEDWQPLFNGTDFAGWDRYLGKPTSADPPLGVDNDPRGVFSYTIVEGESALRISGEVWGALISQKEYCSFHLRGQYKWGTLMWPPLNSLDSGIMYLATGALGAVNAGGNALSDPIGSGAFMVSIEYQLAPADTGGMYNLGPIAFAPMPASPLLATAGTWNQFDIIVQGGTARHLLNGQQVAGGSGFRLNLPGQDPRDLSCGKLQMQSEGGEIYFRHVELTVLP